MLIHNLFWLRKPEGGGVWRWKGGLPLGQIIGSGTTAVQRRGHAKWLSSLSHLLKLSLKRKRQKEEA